MGSRLRTAAVVAVGSAALILSGMGIAAATDRGTSKADGRATVLPHAASIITSDEGVFTSIAPCRLVDTRGHGGTVQAARDFLVSGTASLAAQGGDAKGCGVPAGATGIAANVVATGSTHEGYVKAYPKDGTVPTATTLNYAAKQTIANGVTLAVKPGEGAGLTVSAFSPVNVVIDVTGYYSSQITGFVQGSGSGSFVTSTSRVLSITHTSGTGSYSIKVDRDIYDCSVVVTPGSGGGYASAVTDTGGVFSVSTWTLSNTGAYTATDRNFQFAVIC